MFETIRQTISSIYGALADAVSALFGAISDAISAVYGVIAGAVDVFCTTICYPVLITFFGPINRLLAPIEQPWFTIVAVSFFIGTMLWVWFYLGESYVNLGRREKSVWTDLRIWTVISMLPHVFVYFYFV